MITWKWANTAALAYLEMNRLNSHQLWKEDLAFNSRRNYTYLHDYRCITSWNEFLCEIVGDIEKVRFEEGCFF